MKYDTYGLLTGNPPRFVLEEAAVRLRRASPGDYQDFIQAVQVEARRAAATAMSSPVGDSALLAYHRGAFDALMRIAERLETAEETIRAAKQ